MAILGDHGGHTERIGGPSLAQEDQPEASILKAVGRKRPERAKAKDPNRIGIVFVHGIGSQKPGETLVSWAHPLIRLISVWTATTIGVEGPNDPVTESEIDFGGSGRPFVKVRVPGVGDHPEQEWLMTEAWWASKLSPPSVAEMFRWLFPTEMFRIIGRILKGFGSEFGGLYRAVDFVFMTIFLIPVAVSVFLFYVLFRLLRVIPIKAIQELALLGAVDFFLSDWFGDVRLLLADRAQAANVRAAIAAAIKSVTNEGCGTIVLIGHSGGTIAGYMTLTDKMYRKLQVDRFITHGQALSLVWRLGRACDPSGNDRSVDRLYDGDRLRKPLADARPDTHWFDFWATHDPAPAGGFGIDCDVTRPELCGGESIQVANRMSLRNDHGGYWDNDEGFVLPVARLIETSPTGAPAVSRFFADEPSPSRIERRWARVKLLQFAWVGVMLSAVVSVPLAIVDPLVPGDRGNLAEAGRLAYGFVGWVAGALGFVWDLLGLPELPGAADLPYAAALVIGIVAMLVIFWGVSRVMGTFWNRWDERERAIAMQPRPRWRHTVLVVVQMGLCSGASVALIGFAASGSALALIVPGLALGLAYLVGLFIPPGVVRRAGPLESASRSEVLDGSPGIADV